MTVIQGINGENCDGTDFRMGVPATLAELSEWTLPYLVSGHKPTGQTPPDNPPRNLVFRRIKKILLSLIPILVLFSCCYIQK